MIFTIGTGEDTVKARAIHGAWWDSIAHEWHIEDPDARQAAVMLHLFPSLVLDYPQLQDIRNQLIKNIRPFDNATDAGIHITDSMSKHTVERLTELGMDLYEFQNLDLGYINAVLDKHHGAYIGWERGLGKTLGAAVVADVIEARGGNNKVLVVCTNTAKIPVWKTELEKYLPDARIRIMPNVKKKRDALYEQLKTEAYYQERNVTDIPIPDEYAPWDGPDILVVHYEALDLIAKMRPAKRDGWKPLGKFGLKVLDESHRIKNGATKMARAAKKVEADAALNLSGTILANHPEELFSQLQFLFPKVYKAKWRDWNDRFIDYIEGPFGKIMVGVKQDRLEEMQEELGVFMVYRRKEDELDLPPKTNETLYVEMNLEQRRVYDELIATSMHEFDSGRILTADEGLVMLTRLRQVATGLELLDPDTEDSSKLDLAVDIIMNNPDTPFVVFSWFKASGRFLQKRLEALDVPTFLVDGDVPMEERNDQIARFQAGAGQVFMGTIETIGESVNLQRASNLIRLDRSWNPGKNDQVEDRIFRIGQLNPVTITDIVTRNTVDELKVQPSLLNKEAIRKMILGGTT